MLGKFTNIVALTLAAAAGFTPLASLAQDAYPTKTIRFVVPYPPGGPTDLMARCCRASCKHAWA